MGDFRKFNWECWCVVLNLNKGSKKAIKKINETKILK